MAEAPITDETARALRASWFAYVDTIEPVRPLLHTYGLRLTGSVWDAEDLVQETLLRGFASIGRGDLHGPGSPVANPKAYLFRTATNLWLDQQRRRVREIRALSEPVATPAGVGPDELREAAERLMLASPQARAAVILKDVFEFSLEEIADQLRTTVGGVKAALSRGRAAVRDVGAEAASGPSRELVDRFVDAFMSRDVARITASLTDACDIHVPGVGGGRGRRGGWAEASLGHQGIRLEPAAYQGEIIILGLNLEPDGPDSLYDIIRLEEADGQIARIVNYCFCPDTLRAVGEELGVPVAPWGYHQPPDILPRMIATTTLPWGSEGATFHI